MREVENKIYTFLENEPNIQKATINDVREDNGFFVNNYRELIEHIAQLSFNNPEFTLFYRGQRQDHKDSDKTTLYSTIFRGRDYNYYDVFRKRFKILKRAEELLIRYYSNQFEGRRNLRVYEILRWSILQHYDVCETPLLDITHSIRVACSFAHFDSEYQGESFIYVLGMPQINGSVTASSEQGIQIIRLLSICPPNAKRPHYQEGYLAGEFPTIGYIEKAEYSREEMDFARRLICKFRINNRDSFWDSDFTPIPRDYLYPDERDEMVKITSKIKNKLSLNQNNL